MLLLRDLFKDNNNRTAWFVPFICFGNKQPTSCTDKKDLFFFMLKCFILHLRFLLIIFLCMCGCVFMFMRVHMCACAWRCDINVRHLPLSLVTLSRSQSLSIELMLSIPVNSGFTSTLWALRWQVARLKAHPEQHSHGLSGFELWSLHLPFAS